MGYFHFLKANTYSNQNRSTLVRIFPVISQISVETGFLQQPIQKHSVKTQQQRKVVSIKKGGAHLFLEFSFY